MRHVVGFVLLPVAFMLVAAADASHGTTPALRHVESERVRLRAHFDSVLVELAARDVSRLTSQQRAGRAQLSEWLAEYRDAGKFPLNDLGTANPVPIFRDSRGVLCAMAYLIDRSGRGDLVDAVALSRNTAYIAQLVDDPRLVAWLDSAGLSPREAARIQPTYHNVHGLGTRRFNTILLAGASLFSINTSTGAETRGGGVLGIVVGGITVGSTYGPAFRRYRGRSDLDIRRFTGGLALAAALRTLIAGPWPQPSDADSARLGVGVSPSRDPATGRPTWTVAIRARF